MAEPNAEMAKQLALASCDYEEQRTGHIPKLVTAVLSDDTLVITLRGMLSPAEKIRRKKCNTLLDNPTAS